MDEHAINCFLFFFYVPYFQWMDEHAHLRTLIEEGKDGLEWYRCENIYFPLLTFIVGDFHRSVDPAKMQTVEAMIKAPDHREKMPHIIKTILEFAYLTYSGRESLKPISKFHLNLRRLFLKKIMQICQKDLSKATQ